MSAQRAPKPLRSAIQTEAASRYQRLRTDAVPTAHITWEEIDSQLIWRTLDAVTSMGDAIMFGRTRDGGALVITVMSGDERHKLYGATAELVAAHLTDVLEAARGD